MGQITFISAIVQGITEALPISSSLHLKLLNVENPVLLHFVTGMTGLLYLLLNGRLGLEISYAKSILESYLRKRGVTRNLTILMLLTVFVSITLLNFKSLLKGLHPSLYLSIVNAALILLCETSAPENGAEWGSAQLIYASLLCNLLAILPGFSRLGTVYAGLRFVGLNPVDAIRYSTIQGIFLSSIGILVDLFCQSPAVVTIGTSNILGNFIPSVVCGLVYYIAICLLLRAESRQIRYFIIASCNYRFALAALLFFTN